MQLKASWGKSFKAATLAEQYNPAAIALRPASVLGIAGAGPTDTALIAQGGNPDLAPERATTTTAGLVLGPSFLDSGRFEANWFHSTPALPTAGVIGFPPKFKGRMGAHWRHGDLTVGAIVNHIGGVDDTSGAVVRPGGTMTTVDLVVDHKFTAGVLGGFGFNVSGANLFNRAPPLRVPAAPYFVNYDSTNYAPFGRVVSATVTKRFD